MFTRIQTRSFRCLKSVDQALGPFRALVGPNANGKTTFLDVIGFLGDLVRNRGDVLETVRNRSANFEKLVWMGVGRSFQLAVEADIPDSVKKEMHDTKQRTARLRSTCWNPKMSFALPRMPQEPRILLQETNTPRCATGKKGSRI